MNSTRKWLQEGEETETQTKLMEAAIELFSTKGFRGTSIRDIARAMGMSISNIYHYCGSKDGILVAILERSAGALLESLREVTTRSDLAPEERFRLLLRTHVSRAGEMKRESKIYMIEKEQLSEDARRVSLRIQREVLEIYVNEVRILKEQGMVRTEHLSVLALNVLGVINWLLRWYREDGGLSMEQVAGEIEAFVTRGILGPAPVSPGPG